MRFAFTHSLVLSLLLFAARPGLAQPSQLEPARSPSASLTPPEILEKVDPTYPELALSEKRSGEVVLQLDIDEKGKVSHAEVVKGAGYGMDEAALQAAQQLVFKPALRGEQPTRSRILYKMDFTLRTMAEPEEPKQPEPATRSFATMHGAIRLEQSDVPCAGASVELRLSDGSTLRTASDSAGRFEFERIPAGSASLRIVAGGYDELRSEESFVASERVELTYRVHPSGGGLEVVVQGERADREVTRRTIERQELAVVPGTGGDALKVIESMPGVGRTPALSGMIVVRGSSPYGTQTFIDGAFVPMIYHFGGLSSIVPTEMIDTIDFYPGNFSAKYGRATGGIIDVKMREMDHDGKYHGMAQVDLIDARLMLRGPVPLAKAWSFNLGARRSHVDAWIGSVMSKDAGFRTAPVYYDWQAFAETKPTPRSVFRVGVYGADDRLEMVLKNAIGSDPGIGNSFQAGLRTARLQATYKSQITDRWSVSAMASVGLDRESSKVGAVSSVDLDYIPIILRGDISYRVSDQLLFRAGPDVVIYRYDADVLSLSPPEPGEIEGSHANRPLLRYDKKGYFSAPAAFGELEWTPSTRAKVLLGGRADYFSLNERWDFSPRLNARYDLHTGKRRTSLKAGLGVFMEPPRITQAVPPFGTSGIRSNRSIHSSVGIEQAIDEQVEVSVEAFHKHMDNLVVAARFEDGSNGFSNLGEGYVYGTETMVRWKPGGRFFGWVAYTISRSVRKNAPDQPSHIYEFDQTHNLTVLGSYDLGRGWRVGGKFRFTTGSPYTPCNGGMLNAAAGTYECIPGELNSRRLPPFHQLDVRVDKTWVFNDFRLSTYLDIQNVYNHANPEGVSYNYRYTTAEWQSGLPIVPSLGIRGEF